MTKAAEHFNQIAESYDYWKKKNWYYYDNLKRIFKDLIPEEATVLDIGCGTGEILIGLNPARGLGVDISPAMVEIAKGKIKNNGNIRFLSGDPEDLKNEIMKERFNFILSADTLEHSENPALFLKTIGELAGKDSKIIIETANPLWEPILLILEKFKLKMPEGPHKRISLKEVDNIFFRNNLKIIRKDYRLILPCYIPMISDFINAHFYKIPVLKSFGLIVFWVCRKI